MSEALPFDGVSFARTLPQTPGVYRMLDQEGALLYVGKAINLRRRVASYFQKSPHNARMMVMLSQVASMDTTLTANEAEALILESRLIKTQGPRYNIALRDDTGYPYLYLSSHQEVPRIRLHRGKKGTTGEYFGPYPNREAARTGLDAVLRAFKLRSCEDNFFKHRTRPCLQYQIQRCSAPCVGNTISKEDYDKSVNEARDFLTGKSNDLILRLGEQMEQAASALEFERAGRIRDRIALLRRIQARVDVEGSTAARDAIGIAFESGACAVAVISFREGYASQAQVFHPHIPAGHDANGVMASFLMQYYLDRVIPGEILISEMPENSEVIIQALESMRGQRVVLSHRMRDERARQLAMAVRNAEGALRQHLDSQGLLRARRADVARMLDLPVLPERIECFDISHTQGELTRASCVVFGPEGPIKSAYRLYSIEGIQPGDDYAAMNQALARRFSKPGPLPDLLIIDGGKGQVAQAVEVLDLLGISIPIVGLAKGPGRKVGQEDVIIARTGATLTPGLSSPGLMLLAHVRDEAHRFAIRGHRQAREKQRKQSALEGVDGIGPSRRKALLQAFGGLQEIRRASIEDIGRVPGISRAIAERVYRALHPD